MNGALYRGTRDVQGDLHVFCNRNGAWVPLPPRLDLYNHSPTGLECGYVGSGPAQLALAILADALGNDRRAVKLHQWFHWSLICKLPREENWEITRELLNEHLCKIWTRAN